MMTLAAVFLVFFLLVAELVNAKCGVWSIVTGVVVLGLVLTVCTLTGAV